MQYWGMTLRAFKWLWSDNGLTPNLERTDCIAHGGFIPNGRPFFWIFFLAHCPKARNVRLISLSLSRPPCSHFVTTIHSHFVQWKLTPRVITIASGQDANWLRGSHQAKGFSLMTPVYWFTCCISRNLSECGQNHSHRVKKKSIES